MPRRAGRHPQRQQDGRAAAAVLVQGASQSRNATFSKRWPLGWPHHVFLLSACLLQVVSSDASHVTLSHTSPVNGAVYHVYFLLKQSPDSSCTCLVSTARLA